MKKKFAVVLFSILLVLLSIMPVMAEDWTAGEEYTVTFSIASQGGRYSANIDYQNCNYVSMDVQLSPAVEVEKEANGRSISFFDFREVTGTIQVKVKATNPGKDAVISLNGDAETHYVICKEHEFGEPTRVEATCTTNGSITKTCSVCKYEEIEVIKATGHSFNTPEVIREATCETDGLRRGICSVCGATTDEAIPATGHKTSTFTDKDPGDCQHFATKAAICETCGKEIVEETDKYGEHQFEDPVLVQEASLSKPEIYEGKCKVCGETTKQIGLCHAEDINTGITFTCEEGVFPEEAELNINIVNSEDEFYQRAVESLGDISKEFVLYDIKAFSSNIEVNPNGNVEVVFPIPESYGKKIGLYSISKDGNIKEIEGAVSFDGLTYTVNLTEMSSFAICKISNTNGKTIIIPDNIKIYIGIGLVLIIVLIIFLIIVSKRRRIKKARAEIERKREIKEETIANVMEREQEEGILLSNSERTKISNIREDYIPGSYSSHLKEASKDEAESVAPSYGVTIREEMREDAIQEETDYTLEEMVRKFNRLKKREKK